MREFSVKKGCLGYIVNIGCQVCGFSNVQDIKAAICEYLDDPKGAEKKYYNGTVEATQRPVDPEAPQIERATNRVLGLRPASENEQGPVTDGRVTDRE